MSTPNGTVYVLDDEPEMVKALVRLLKAKRFPQAMARLLKRLERIPELKQTMHPTGPGHYGVADRGIMAMLMASAALRMRLSTVC